MEEFKKHQHRTQSYKNYMSFLKICKGLTCTVGLSSLLPLKYLAVENKVFSSMSNVCQSRTYKHIKSMEAIEEVLTENLH